MAKLPWKCWHEVVKLREDLRTGELSLNLFAADLYEVLMQHGKHPIYEKADSFFSLTYPTYNLRELVKDVVLRLAGKNDKAVRQLELTYGGGKTHTLITLYHLVNDPDSLPDLPAVDEFASHIGQKPKKSIVAGLCFDKLDVEKGMEVRSPDGKTRVLKQPWSVLAYQIAGDEGLKLLHAEGKSEERESAPAENILTELLEKPVKKGLGVLVLIDEVLMYAREKVAQDKESRGRLVNFFQYLTQAAAKVKRCCIVASLLASDPKKSDTLGRELQGELYDIFQRQREEAVEPVVKEDVAEVLRRRFFTPESLRNKDEFRQHVVAALKGIGTLDEQIAKQGQQAESRFLESYPFHPDLTEVFYAKWTTLDRFQKTRGVLRTFALALREAEKWDTNPLVAAGVFLNASDKTGLSEAMRELVTVADTEEWEGRKQAWTGILDNELNQAKQIQQESVGLKFREIEQAVAATFLHSQPIGQNAKTRDLLILLGATRPDKIEVEKGLIRWAQSSYWLDDLYTATTEGRLPGTWRLGNRPNLVQMHANAARGIPDETAAARLLDEIGKAKCLTANASAAGVKVHTLPSRPRDIEDDGAFHYAVLGPNAASESGKPSAEACRYLDETTGPDKPRVYRNALILLVPSRDGLEVAMARVRDYLAWEVVREDVKKQQRDGNVDPARAQTLQINIDKAKGRVPEAIKQAYCIVVTVAQQNENQAFKISSSDEPHFSIIKNDKRSRIQDTAVTPEALLPDGPYNLWRNNETARRVKDLSGAFAQLPHLPKMLRANAILETLASGCETFSFVLRLVRPDGTARTWWGSRPDEAAMNDPALELALPRAAELGEIPAQLLAPKQLPGLWTGDEILFRNLSEYFKGGKKVTIERNGISEPLMVPRASDAIIEQAVCAAIEKGLLWLQAGPASILSEPVPTGLIGSEAKLSAPPIRLTAAEILEENLPQAWKKGSATGLSLATALSVKIGKTLPWKTVSEAISDALQARFLELDAESGPWPCDFPSAQQARFRAYSHAGGSEIPRTEEPGRANILVAETELEPRQIQDIGDIVPKLLEIKAKSNVQMKFSLRVELGDGGAKPDKGIVEKINALLKDIKKEFYLR
jgi:hypothetical protein